jgi:hypothetical protein
MGHTPCVRYLIFRFARNKHDEMLTSLICRISKFQFVWDELGVKIRSLSFIFLIKVDKKT